MYFLSCEEIETFISYHIISQLTPYAVGNTKSTSRSLTTCFQQLLPAPVLVSNLIIYRLKICTYEVKNNLCLFEKPFKIQNNDVFLFEISFFVLEIMRLFYYANQISDDVTLFATKKWKILNKRYLWKY